MLLAAVVAGCDSGNCDLDAGEIIVVSIIGVFVLVVIVPVAAAAAASNAQAGRKRPQSRSLVTQVFLMTTYLVFPNSVNYQMRGALEAMNEWQPCVLRVCHALLRRCSRALR